MKVLSLFDGISCGMVALERAGIPVENYAAFEIDKYAIQVSKKNYPQIKQRGNVFDGDFTNFKDYDLLLGGSPCTYWSIAKKSRETTANGEGFRLFGDTRKYQGRNFAGIGSRAYHHKFRACFGSTEKALLLDEYPEYYSTER